MTLVAVTSTVQIAAPPPRRTPVYVLVLACGHRVYRRLADGPLPKRVRCPECTAG